MMVFQRGSEITSATATVYFYESFAHNAFRTHILVRRHSINSFAPNIMMLFQRHSERTLVTVTLSHVRECKSGFPFVDELTPRPLLVGQCVATERNLPTAGPRGRIGSFLVERNHAWLNAAPPAWLEFHGDNGDIKFPQRCPILA